MQTTQLEPHPPTHPSTFVLIRGHGTVSSSKKKKSRHQKNPSTHQRQDRQTDRHPSHPPPLFHNPKATITATPFSVSRLTKRVCVPSPRSGKDGQPHPEEREDFAGEGKRDWTRCCALVEARGKTRPICGNETGRWCQVIPERNPGRAECSTAVCHD